MARYKKVSILIFALVMATPGATNAQFSGLLVKAKNAVKDAVKVKGASGVTNPAASPTPITVTPNAAPTEPRADPTVKDRFVTRKDVHGHDYDALTGYLICLDKPRKYKSAPYAMSLSETKIPEGHLPNLSCISADREWVTT